MYLVAKIFSNRWVARWNANGKTRLTRDNYGMQIRRITSKSHVCVYEYRAIMFMTRKKREVIIILKAMLLKTAKYNLPRDDPVTVY